MLAKIFVAAALLLLFVGSSARAANCSTYPYTLTANTTADASQVMSDLNNVLNCINNNFAAGLNLANGATVTGNITATGSVTATGTIATSGNLTAAAGGLEVGAPTGGIPAAGIANTKGYLVNNVAVPATNSINVILSTTGHDTTAYPDVMAGFGSSCAITPKTTGTVFLAFTGTLSNTTVGDSAEATLYYGTGTAPAAKSIATGTQVSGTASTGDNLNRPFSVSGVVAGLTLSTPIWFDLQIGAVGGGGLRYGGVALSCAAFEM